VVGCWRGISLERSADLHMAQLMPLPLTVSCFSKIQIGLPFWYQLTRVVPEKGPLNGCVCVCVFNVDWNVEFKNFVPLSLCTMLGLQPSVIIFSKAFVTSRAYFVFTGIAHACFVKTSMHVSK